MKIASRLLVHTLGLAFLVRAPLLAQQPLRIFIRSSEKTHGAGPIHDYPAFLNEWKALLTEKGAVVSGDKRFPSDEELAKTDVLLVYSSDGGNVAPDERTRLNNYLKRGGGMVIIHDAMCGADPLWQASVIGAAKQHGERNSRAGKFTLTFTDRNHPIIGGMPDLEMNDEMFFLLRAEGLKPDADGKPVMWTYGMKVSPEIHVLATTPDPSGNVVPQMWTYEHTVPGGKPYRVFVSLEGHALANFSAPEFQGILLRGIAWTANRPVETLLKK
ncbi:MAG TPA: ThuA domain-containing protein [Bryobacteraceae bacterium]|nr:ThuA domain-containing protein [Bryobacteraceae bacterium]